MNDQNATKKLFSLKDLTYAMVDEKGRALMQPVASDTAELPGWRTRGKAKSFNLLSFLRRSHPDSGFPEHIANARKFDACEVLHWVRSLKVQEVAGASGSQYALWRYAEGTEPYEQCECGCRGVVSPSTDTSP